MRLGTAWKTRKYNEKVIQVKKWSLLQLHIIIFTTHLYNMSHIFFFQTATRIQIGPWTSKKMSKKKLEQTPPQHLSQFKNGQSQSITHNTLISFSNPQINWQYITYSVSDETSQDQIKDHNNPAIEDLKHRYLHHALLTFFSK
jgi:hypothetical protein